MGRNNSDNRIYHKANPPFKAYNGDKPYIFVSYKHIDADIVYPMIKKFHDMGFNIWYDEGLPYGENFDIVIPEKIEGATLFINFLTQACMECAHDSNDYLIKESDIAQYLEVPILAIYPELEEFRLRGYYLTNYLKKQSLYRHDYGDDDDIFIGRCVEVFMSKGLEPDEVEDAVPEVEETVPEVDKTVSEVEDAVPEVEDTVPEVEDFVPEVVETVSEGDNAFADASSFQPYEGDEPYIFVSYKHKEWNRVFPIVKRLQDEGFNIWCDNSSTGGKQYDIEIADLIENSQLFVTLITEDVIKGARDVNDYLIKELSVAINLKKDILPIFLDDVQLKGFYLIHYTGRQSIFMQEYADEDKFIEACANTFKNDFGINQDSSPASPSLPAPAYGGSEPFIFVSYAHADSSRVFPEIKRLKDLGLNVWYDEGIAPGNEWLRDILEHLNACDLYVIFVTQNSVNTVNVKKELRYAISKEKNILPIYLDDFDKIEMDLALEYELSSIQGILKTTMDDEEYKDKLITAFKSFDFQIEDSNPSADNDLHFPAYAGDEPYIFAAYSHRDSDLVLTDLKRFNELGYNIWHDGGIAPGSEWKDEIENALLNSSLLVVFLSDNAVESKNVRNETFLALSEEMPVLPIYLEETELKHGLRLSLMKSEPIFKYRMSDEGYVQSVIKAFETHGLNAHPKIDIFGIDYSFRNPDCPIYALTERIYPYWRSDSTDFSDLSDEKYFSYETIAINALCLVKASGRNFHVNGSDIHLDLSNADNWDTFKEARLLFVDILKELGWTDGRYDYDKKTVSLSLFGGSLAADAEERHMQRIIESLKKAGCS